MLTHILSQIEGVEVLTQSSLQHLIDALQTEEDEIKDGIYEWTNQLLCQSANEQQLRYLVEAVGCLKQTSSEEEFQSLLDQLTEYKKRSLEIREIERRLKQKEFQVTLEQQYEVFEQHKSQNEYSEAAWCLLGMQRMIQDHQTEDSNTDSTDLQHFSESLAKGDQALRKVIMDAFEDCVRIQADKKEVMIISGHTEADMERFREAWKAAEVLKMVDLILHNISMYLKEVLLEHVLKEDFTGTLLETEVVKSQQNQIIRWGLKESDNVLNSVKSRFGFTQQILELIAKDLLFELESLLLELGSQTWTQIHQLLTQKTLDCGGNLRENEQLHFLQGIYLAAEEMEENLKTIGFLPEEETSLSSTLAESSKSALRKLSGRFIQEARDWMLNPEWEVIEVGAEPVFDTNWIKQQIAKEPKIEKTKQSVHHVDRSMTRNVDYANSSISENIDFVDRSMTQDSDYVDRSLSRGFDCADWSISQSVDYLDSIISRGQFEITETANRIRHTIESAAIEGVAKGPLVLQCLIQAICDICFMHRSLYPILHQKEIQVPQLGMLVANDFLYLSQELLKLPILVSGFRSLAPDVNFIKEAQQLHASGRGVLQGLVKSQNKELKMVLTDVGNFGALRTGQQGIAMRKASNQLIRMLQKLGQNMSETLSNSDHCSMAASLAKGIAEPILSALMSRTEISAQESKELPAEVESLLDQLTPSLLNIPPPELERMKSDAQGFLTLNGKLDQERIQQWMLHRQFSVKCPELRKLQRVLKLWDSSLKRIVEWWRSGLLEEEGFTSEDIRNIIWALFEHSENREEAIFAVTS